MENKEIIIAEKNFATAEEPKDEFKGYSMEELHYQRAMIALRKEFCKAKIVQEVDRIRKKSFLGGSKGNSKVSKIGTITKKLLSGLNYLDYALVGLSLFGTGKKIFKFFRRKS